MEIKVNHPGWNQIRALLRGEVEYFGSGIERREITRFAIHLAVIVGGTGLYGAAMGWWRDPRQALFTAIKFPLIVLLTAVGNGLLNGMFAPLLGLNVPFRRSFSLVLMSFTVAAAILGSLSPLAAFLVWNAPSLSRGTQISAGAYDLIQLTHVAAIAFAGTVANLRLAGLLRELSGETRIARRVLLAWLAGNLFLGSQLSWILRPFIGSPVLPVEFLRATAFKGNFYETVFRSVVHLLNSN